MAELVKEQVRLFFHTARERQMILLRRQAGWSRELWTSDPVLRRFHFCNVFRCDDRVSREILELARSWGDPWRAALAGRLVNRYDTILRLQELGLPATAEELAEFIRERGLNTNAYRLNTPLGLNSKEGVVLMYLRGAPLGGAILAKRDLPGAMEEMSKVDRLGGFIRYQVALDLIELGAFGPGFRDDVAYPGMGACRGGMRMLGEEISGSWEERRSETYDATLICEVMFRLLELSRDPSNWNPAWRPWTIHEAEGWLCEYDKWARRANEESAGGRRYKGPFILPGAKLSA